MSDAIAAALIGLAGSAVGAFGGVMASARLTQYRLRMLEDKVEKHNSLVERTFRLEGRMDEAEHDIRDLKGVRK
ncbi:MAG: hypothetical protein IKQ80_02610 [Clostridia bacterium]|nr:hypothetical protein [Clostridia bacterium]